jgi:hypothetical protein
MNIKRFLVLVSGLVYFLSFNVNALPTKCLQLPERKQACPHLIYKKAALPVVRLDVEKGNIICICLTDVNFLKNQTNSAVEKIDQQVTFERLTDYYQLTEQDILTLLKH